MPRFTAQARSPRQQQSYNTLAPPGLMILDNHVIHHPPSNDRQKSSSNTTSFFQPSLMTSLSAQTVSTSDSSSPVFASDTILVRLLDNSTSVGDLYYLLSTLGELQHVDFSFLAFSRSVSASYFDTRHAVAVSSALQRITGISSCIWRSTRNQEDRIARIPLKVPAGSSDWSELSQKVCTFLAQFGEVDKLDIGSDDMLTVTYFDVRSKARLIARLASMTSVGNSSDDHVNNNAGQHSDPLNFLSGLQSSPVIATDGFSLISPQRRN